MKRIAILLCISFCFNYSISLAQNTSPSQASWKQNTALGSVSLMGLGGTFNINYERTILYSTEKPLGILNIRGGAGGFSSWGTAGRHGNVGVVLMTSRSKHRIELVAGGALTFNKLNYDISVSNANYLGEAIPSRIQYMNLIPAASAGYRLQKIGKPFVFRAGVGFPEGVYFGLGLAF